MRDEELRMHGQIDVADLGLGQIHGQTSDETFPKIERILYRIEQCSISK